MRLTLPWLNLALRGLMELGIVAALGYWGYQVGVGLGTSILFGIGAPLLGFGYWSAVDFRRAGRLAEPLRLFQELVISAVAVLAWYAVGQPVLAAALGLVSVVHHVLVYLLGDSLLKRQHGTPTSSR
jgi:hypothetical protein